MKLARRTSGQSGFTLVELIIALALGALLMTALTSVILTGTRAVGIASSRVEASAQIRNFEFFAYDDFAQSRLPSGTSCAPATNCMFVLDGYQFINGVFQEVQVTYTWDGSNFLDRSTSTGYAGHAATNVTAFSWSVDSNSTVVAMTVTMQPDSAPPYSESQTFRFYSRTASP